MLAEGLEHLPRTFALVYQASGKLSIVWSLLLVAQGVLPVATVYLTRDIVNALVAAVRNGGQWQALRPVIVYSVGMGAVAVTSQLLRGLANWVRTAQSELVRDHLASLIQQKSLEVDLAFYDSSDFYNHLHRARTEASHRPIEMLEGLGSLLQGGITVAALFAVLVPFGPVLPLVLLLSTMPALYVMLKMAYRRHRYNQSTTMNDRRAWYFDTLLTGGETAAEMRLFNLGDHFLGAFRDVRRALRHEKLALARHESILELWAGAGSLLILAVTMVWMVRRAIYGMISLGDLALFYQAFNQGFGLSRTLLDNLGKLYENSLFLGNLFEFLDLKPQIVSPPDALNVASPLTRGIQFRNVTFQYPGSARHALQDFNLDVRPGQIAALVGPNGAGKSTLLKLLCRFYDPNSGTISLDGVPLSEISITDLRRSVSAFFQQPVRYNDTVAANIRYGDFRLTSQEFSVALDRAAEDTGLTEIISRLPHAYDTQLGHDFLDGVELSVGEWQRLGLVRAAIRQAQILVLDEPTSAMDPWAELKWAERLRAMAAGRITILITHRFTTAMFADVIHVMSKGRIVESGPHAELLAKGRIYAEGWASQVKM